VVPHAQKAILRIVREPTQLRCTPPGSELDVDLHVVLLVRIHYIIIMIKWTGLAPWEFELAFPSSLTSTSLAASSTWTCAWWPRSPKAPTPARSRCLSQSQFSVDLSQSYRAPLRQELGLRLQRQLVRVRAFKSGGDQTLKTLEERGQVAASLPPLLSSS
jgi:hypothetical protein